MIAVRATNLIRAPLITIPKRKSGGPTFKGVGQALAGLVRGGPKKDKNGEPIRTGPDLLNGVSFELEKGTITVMPGADMRAIDALMQVMASSLPLTSGRIEVNGSIAGLIRVGDNLEDELTMYEVVPNESRYLSVPAEARDRFYEQVLEFSGLREFEDVQIRRFSTGMKLRLSLAIVLMAKPSVIVLGDVMGVGDLDFRQRATEHVKQMAEDGTTFLLGGPGFGMDGLASRRLYFEQGKISSDTSLTEADDEPEGPATHDWHVAQGEASSGPLAITGIAVTPPGGNRRRTTFRIGLRARGSPIKVRLALDFLVEGTLIFRSVNPEAIAFDEPGWGLATVTLPPILSALTYKVRLNCTIEAATRTWTMRIANAIDAVPTHPVKAADVDVVAKLQPELEWTIEPIASEPQQGESEPQPGEPATQSSEPALK